MNNLNFPRTPGKVLETRKGYRRIGYRALDRRSVLKTVDNPLST